MSLLLAVGMLTLGGLTRGLSATAESAWLRAANAPERDAALRLTGLGVELGSALLALGCAATLLQTAGPTAAVLGFLLAPLTVAGFDLLPRTLRPTAASGGLAATLGRFLRLPGGATGSLPPPRAGLGSQTRVQTGDQADAERAMIRGVFDFADATVTDLMIPLVDVTALPETSSLEQAAQIIKQRGVSRIPIYRHQLPDIVGVLHAFDLLDPGGARRVSDLMTRPTFVPEMIHAGDALRRMQAEGIHLAIVIDEFGGAVGIITIEDILEEVIGQIDDEHDPASEPVREIEPGRWRVRGRAELWVLQDRLGWSLPCKEVQTIGGLMLLTLGRVPTAGEAIEVGNLRICAIRTTDRAVEEVEVQRQEAEG